MISNGRFDFYRTESGRFLGLFTQQFSREKPVADLSKIVILPVTLNSLSLSRRLLHDALASCL
jgi:hypothetical protein